METELITITQYCFNYNIEPSFIDSLEDSGIISFTVVDSERFVHVEQLVELDKYIHLHYDLHINMEGIDAIRHLLQRIDGMQQEIRELRTRVRLHE
jgi:chaperone modulatory protein CbpM